MRGLPQLARRKETLQERMDRRNFFKLVGTASGGAVAGACGREGDAIIPLLVPEEQIVPGVEEWRPSVCRQCPAGCGTIVRVMRAERILEIDGEKVRKPIAAVKKIEGNPLDPVSGGRICGRGQAAVQRLYHPDRPRGPKIRNAAGVLEGASWDAALDRAAEALRAASAQQVLYLAAAVSGSRSAAVSSFLEGCGYAPARTAGTFDFEVERAAAQYAFGWNGIPLYEIQDADFVLSIGADFLGGWVSPVLYARRFGHMRRGRESIRGALFHAEARFSQTAWAADRWLPAAPGGEHALALAVGALLLQRHGKDAASLPPALAATLREADIAALCRQSGVRQSWVEEAAGRLASAAAPVVIGGASIVRGNSVAAAAVANALNLILGNVGRAGGVKAPSRPLDTAAVDTGAARPTAVFLDGIADAAVPLRVRALLDAATVIAFQPSAHADVLLPDHDALEAGRVVSPITVPGYALTGGPSFVRPLYDTRASEDVLSAIAKRLGKSAAVPPAPYEEIFAAQDGFADTREFVSYAERQGGWWQERSAEIPAAPDPEGPWGSAAAPGAPAASAYPLTFQAFSSVQYGDGGGADLPWLRQLPDPASSLMFDLPLEIDPDAAAALGVRNGDRLKVISAAGSVEAPAYVNPAAVPGVVSLGLGGTADALALLPPESAEGAGAQIFSCPARVERVGRSDRFLQFTRIDRDEEPARS